MQLLHRPLHVASEAQRQDLDAAADGLVDCRTIVGRGLLQHVVGDRVPVARVADAQAQAPVVVRAEALRDVAQAVVPGNAAALLHLGDARREVELVVHHQDLGGVRS